MEEKKPTIDERLEALVQTVEIMAIEGQRILKVAELQSKQLAKQSSQIRDLRNTASDVLGAIENHEDRLRTLEKE